MESTMKIPKLELPEPRNPNPKPTHNPNPNDMIVLSSSSDSDSDDDDVSGKRKKRKLTSDMILPLGFLDPLPSKERPSLALTEVTPLPELESEKSCVLKSCKQFWKAGDFEVAPSSRHWDSSLGGMDHVRVHPKFLHSNATSHKWVLGAFAELLDNSLDELCHGATYANIDMVINKKDGSRMLLIDDDGGGMSPDKMRQCMSLGYSAKSKMADTIGQYGNGFKTSTMRLGADVIVFSRSPGINGDGPTQTIGLLSYTFLMSTGKEDIVVPMLDYEKRGQEWSKIVRSCIEDWNKNVETVVQWSPFVNEADLLRQFNQMKEHGTRIFIYNLWEDDQGQLELDFDTDPHDIQIRGVNRDDKNIQMAQQYPNSRHFLTYRHSLRSYASILYLRVPPNFRVILRGRDVEHHNIVNDMMMTQEVTYRPQPGADGIPKDANMVVSVTIGFVKDAKAHIDVSGFNVYHKNRLIKPFWKLWHPPGSDGRGVIGVLEANFVEPAHDKQGFERTIVLSRLEARLIQMQKTYWTNLCHKIGYAPRTKKSKQERGERGAERETYSDSPISNLKSGGAASNMSPPPVSSSSQREGLERRAKSMVKRNGGYARIFDKMDGKYRSFRQDEGPSEEYQSDDDIQITSVKKHSTNGHSSKVGGLNGKNGHSGFRNHSSSRSNGSKSKGGDDNESSPRSSEDSLSLRQLIEENRELKEKLKRKEEEILGDLLHDLQSEREKLKSLESQLEEATKKIESMNKEQDNLIDIFAEERQRRDLEEEALRKKLKDASETIQELVEKITTTN